MNSQRDTMSRTAYASHASSRALQTPSMLNDPKVLMDNAYPPRLALIEGSKAEAVELAA